MKCPGLAVPCLACLIAANPLCAQSAPASSATAISSPNPAATPPQPAALGPGAIQAVIVQGEVELIAKDGTASPLTRGQIFQEGCIVKVGAKSEALLVFSNGATLKVLPNCQIAFTKFQQAPFDEAAAGTFLRLSKDPSKSIVELDLRNGRAVFDVKQLNQAAGSTFSIATPSGMFLARGSGNIFSISARRNSTGQVAKVLGNSYGGALEVHSSTPHEPAIIPAGGQIQLRRNIDQPAGKMIESILGAGIPEDYSQKEITAIYDTINSAITGVSMAAPPPPKASPPTPPKDLPPASFDPDPDSL